MAILGGILLPTLAKGIIIRRPLVLSIAERFDVDRRAIGCMQRIRERYDDGPLLLRLPGRTYALMLHHADVHRVLA